MSPVDRKSLLKKVREANNEEANMIKGIQFPLPDPHSPSWNAVALANRADALMKAAGVADYTRSAFQTKWRESGSYNEVLQLIDDTFTAVSRKDEYVPVASVVQHHADVHQSPPEDENDREMTAEEAGVVAKIEVSEEERTRMDEAKRKAEEMVRAQLGLADDEIVVIQIKKVKK